MPRSFTNWFLATMVCGVFFLILFGIAYLLSGRSIGTFGETVFVSIIVGAVGGSLITGLIDEKGLMLATVQDGLKGDFKNFFVNTPYEQIGSWQTNISRKEWDHLQKQYGQI